MGVGLSSQGLLSLAFLSTSASDVFSMVSCTVISGGKSPNPRQTGDLLIKAVNHRLKSLCDLQFFRLKHTFLMIKIS